MPYTKVPLNINNCTFVHIRLWRSSRYTEGAHISLLFVRGHVFTFSTERICT